LVFKLKPVSTTPAPEEDTTLPDPPPPEPQQPEASAGGDEQGEATNATPADGTSKCLTPTGNCLDRRLRGLNAFRLAGAPQPSTEEATGTSRNPGDLLVSGSGYKNIITKDLMNDPLLMILNMRYFQKISK
jgi:hypothetical protein